MPYGNTDEGIWTVVKVVATVIGAVIFAVIAALAITGFLIGKAC